MTTPTLALDRAGSTHEKRRQTLTGYLMAGPAILLMLLFVISPFFAGIYYSFTNQRLISGNETEVVGLRNYQRLLALSTLTVDPEVDDTTGDFVRDENGDLVFPRSRDFTRDEEAYPQYAGLREWFTVQIGDRLTYVLAGDPLFMRSLTNNFFFAIIGKCSISWRRTKLNLCHIPY